MQERAVLRHFLAAIAYRTQKALREAPPHYPEFDAGHQVRTPVAILRHMTSLMGYTRTLFVGGTYPVRPEPLASFDDEIDRFHGLLQGVAELLDGDQPLREITHFQLLQGPFADVMTHVGQLALLRRLADAPVPPENFIYADIRMDRLGSTQPAPARPDPVWPEGPATSAQVGQARNRVGKV